ncbi:unnamed protein product [Linum trigynum]|uniref:Uncharacterized protein n=1 Tax=Linum trigynum TaxID=586398 RepID=A0AAV2E542_9ROSI
MGKTKTVKEENGERTRIANVDNLGLFTAVNKCGESPAVHVSDPCRDAPFTVNVRCGEAQILVFLLDRSDASQLATPAIQTLPHLREKRALHRI